VKLSRQEETLVMLRISGLNDREAAEQLGLALETVRSYWKRIRLKMHGRTRAQIIASFTKASAAEELNAIRAETEVLKREIEKRRRVERMLRESESKYRMLFENTLDAIFLTDENRCFVDVNPAMANLLGYERKEMIGSNFEDYLASDDVEESRRIRKQILKRGLWEGTFNMVHRSGRLVNLRFRAMFNVVPNQVLGVAVPSRKEKADKRVRVATSENETADDELAAI